MDAGDAKTYAKIREVPESKYLHMLGNLESLAEAGVPNLGTSFIVTKENHHGIVTAAWDAYNAGAKYFRVGAFYNPLMQDYYGLQLRTKVESKIAQAKVDLGDFVLDQFTKRVDYMGRKPDHPFCGYQYLNVYIGGDLGVYRCCEYAYNDHGKVGSLKDQTLRKFMYNHEVDQKYICFDATKCATCPFHTKNELLEFMTRKDIDDLHPEFP